MLAVDLGRQFKDMKHTDHLNPRYCGGQDPMTNFGSLEISHHRIHWNSLKIAQLPLGTFQLTVAATETCFLFQNCLPPEECSKGVAFHDREFFRLPIRFFLNRFFTLELTVK